jgi:chloramphenicol 3-O-phosphotransferase
VEATRPPQRVVILNGPAGVGKTTVGRLLAVFEYCFEVRGHVQRFLAAYTASAPVFLFTLWAPLAVVEARERARNGRSPLGERVAHCHSAQLADSNAVGMHSRAIWHPQRMPIGWLQRIGA